MYTNAQSLVEHKDEIFHQIMKKRNPAVVALSETRVDANIEDFEINIRGYNQVRCDAENRYTGGVVVYIRNDIKFETVMVKNVIGNCWCVVIGLFEKWYKGMKQCVNQPTRVTINSCTLIDLVFANLNLSECVTVVENPKITDHSWIRIEFKTRQDENCYKEFRGRAYKRMNIENFISELQRSVVNNCELDINERASSFVKNIVAALDVVAPERTFQMPKAWEGKIWFTDDIERASIARDRAYGKAVYTGLKQDWQQYKIERNVVVKLIKYKKKQYYENMIDANKTDSKRMWKTLKEVLKGEVLDVKVIDSIKKVDDQRSTRRTMHTCENIEVLEYFNPINANELETVVMNLPVKKGTEEGISVDVLKIAFCAIKDEFTEVINKSLMIGECPNSWKTSTIVPIPKIKKPIKASDYRPINVLPIYEKVLELVVKDQIGRYLEANEVLTEHQSGFRKSHSCETAIQGIIDEWKVEIDEGKIVGVISMDLKRAFETVDRNRLLEKLYQIGIRGKVWHWLESYLKNRTQKVRFNSNYSKVMAIDHGVPQGSVLGPLLFVLYINDITEVCPIGSNVKLFADDTMIYVTGECSEEINKKMNDVFHKIENWMSLNKLKLNVEKTKYMIVRSNRKEVKGQIKIVCMNGEVLKRVEVIKYLGIMIDSRLTFVEHCDYMLKKIGKKTSFLNRMGQYLTPYSRQIVYKTIIAPHFEYCATVIVGMGETQINKLQVAQNRAMRILKGYLPRMLRNRLDLVGENYQRETRQKGNIVVQLRKTCQAQRSAFYKGTKMYNDLPAEVKQCERLNSFKRMLKDYVTQMVPKL
ncbi:uncharacterized protein LOC112639318 [Camponotus floridanus]|uniref:uncharacterized protein LOC112639318 n=1 Tax=Camponotus floridanus TaxID=104421 RepID=UPI000DC67F31|nr:uncharacterized protein LOC112639318 [Camponotus floridanus]